MRTFDLITILIVLAAFFSYVNFKVLKLPAAIRLMALTLLFSVAVFVAGHVLPTVGARVEGLLAQLDLDEALLHGMLGFLRFAGAIHVNLGATSPGTAGRCPRPDPDQGRFRGSGDGGDGDDGDDEG